MFQNVGAMKKTDRSGYDLASTDGMQSRFCPSKQNKQTNNSNSNNNKNKFHLDSNDFSLFVLLKATLAVDDELMLNVLRCQLTY